jgi:hypothetical protein
MSFASWFPFQLKFWHGIFFGDEPMKKRTDKRLFLKVKIKSLAEEARIIRLEECRARDPHNLHELHQHRVDVVRKASRNTLLAYGFLRGRTRAQMEPTAKNEWFNRPNWDEVRRMVKQYGLTWQTEHGFGGGYDEAKKAEAARLEAWIAAKVSV